MVCTKCGALMDQTDKNTMTGRVIREYLCRNCGHTDWEDDGVALWKVLHDAREKDEAEAAQASANAAPEPAPSSQNRRASLWRRLTRLFRSVK
jgi:DNA-directed RNA polymerase subunit M/transcription elongation factor TFIIS